MKSFLAIAALAFALTVFTSDSYAQVLNGSIPSGSVSPQPLQLSMSDALDRGLRYNLAILLGAEDQRAVSAQRLRALYELYPKVVADFSGIEQQINLAAFGFTGFPGVRPIIGPFGLIDARARFSQTVYDRKLIEDLREASENQKAVSFGNQNTRELVVVTIAYLYLQALAGDSRVTAVEAQVARAQKLLDRANDLKNSGLVPGIDVLRAQVELQNQQQRLLALRNEFAQEKLNLARAIGIPLGQVVILTDRMPPETVPTTNLETALQAAQDQRPDIKRADALVQAANHAVDSAHAKKLPVLDFAADYGTIGQSPAQNHGTFALIGRVRVPIFNIEHSVSDQQQAQARAEQRRLEAADLKGRAELEVRAAYLDMQSSAEQVRVANSSLDLAQKQLDQAQDRFEAGVTGNLEVTQAQEAVALSQENVISSLYTLNVAKARLARAMGSAEQSIKTFLGGTK
jgi:outer membrane protein TolC